jgi:hypothetical protein
MVESSLKSEETIILRIAMQINERHILTLNQKMKERYNYFETKIIFTAKDVQ